MDDPEASSHKGSSRPTAARSARAIVSGLIVDIGPVPVHVQASDVGRAAAVVRSLGHLVPSDGPAQLQIRFGVPAPACPTRPPDESYDALEVWREGDLLALRHTRAISASFGCPQMRSPVTTAARSSVSAIQWLSMFDVVDELRWPTLPLTVRRGTPASRS